MKKITTIIGARPQFIKASVVSRALTQCDDIEEVIIHTGQHFDENMSKIFFEEMNIPIPKYNLNINNLSHGAMTGKMIEKIEHILINEKPDFVLVYGDTNSTIAGALAAKKLHIIVAHVEAGLRSFNNKMPEEINRILTDRISDLLFCPTDNSKINLKKEGFETFKCDIIKCGDVMLDAALYYSKFEKKPNIEIPNEFILTTIHREENTNNPDNLISIFNAFNIIAKDVPIILPLHPRTRKYLIDNHIKIENSQIYIIDPVSYLEMLYLLQRCKLVMTDSGGLQKEAFFFKKYCITLRDETEWVELVDNKFNLVSGSATNDIINNFNMLKNRKSNFEIELYGKGQAGKIIVDILKRFINE